MKESFQLQLLQQDFSLGRGIRCAVFKVNPAPSEDNLYNLKLLFEEFDTLTPTDDFVVTDRGEGGEFLYALFIAFSMGGFST